MTFQPVVISSGLTGWRFLQSTLETQKTAFETSAVIQSDVEYFRKNIRSVGSAADLVKDRRLLSVALRAFGLAEDIGNTFFIRKILEDGTSRPDALANRLADSRYKALSEAFGFGDLPVARTQLSYFANELVERFHQTAFEVAVGEQDNDMRLAMNTRRELSGLALSGGRPDTLWFRIMGNPPLREVFEVALGLPRSFGQLDLDQQLSVFRDKASRQLGTGEVADFADDRTVEKLIQRFFVRRQVTNNSLPSASIALTLVQAIPRSSPFPGLRQG